LWAINRHRDSVELLKDDRRGGRNAALGNRAELRRWKNAVAGMWADIIDG
jgi:hypothetical protein